MMDYRTVWIPNREQFFEMLEHFSMNGYKIEPEIEHHEMDILEDEFPYAETCFRDHNINYVILF